MNQRAKYVFGLIFSFVLGSGFTWFNFHKNKKVNHGEVKLGEIFKLGHLLIPEANNSCDGKVDSTVGDVLAFIYESNQMDYVNRVDYYCLKGLCSISYNYCKPWQSSECGQRVLRFEILQNTVVEDSIHCIDIP